MTFLSRFYHVLFCLSFSVKAADLALPLLCLSLSLPPPRLPRHGQIPSLVRLPTH